MTFSIAGRCPETGQIGFAVTTSSVCVGARVGAVTDGCVVFSQARTDPRLHRVGVDSWGKTGSAQATLDAMQAAAVAPHWRQLGVLPATGEAVHLTGASCLPHCGGLTGANSLALGNFLGTDKVLPALIETFEAEKGPLAWRLVKALRAGEAAGSEVDPLQSSAVMVLGQDDLKDVDLRVDYAADPLVALQDLLADWLPKAPAYRLRAIDPDSAPSSSLVERKG
ncbi:DUF1028 domain-containing protein [Arenibacterium halophilum]|uniref:DUF1028 domain-containing protein n=1 Tax=Arenibacterium halophilum TaxID=2583821 RepID=A0ABY2X742_9RHOB|nr:DUF1028 domain-containing protein [Arenibacterium halophilum]TMV11602.1 DUF1028 domain-containing protein [Arenibacterium halophilum]